MSGSRRLPAVPRIGDRTGAGRRRPRLRRAGLVALALVPLGLLGWLLLSSPLFALHRVQVVGVSRVTEAEVQQAVAVPAGTPLARVDLAAVRERVGRLAAVERALVSRGWPGTLRVRVVERVAVATARAPEQDWLLVDREGLAFARSARAPAGLPRLETAAPTPTDPATAAALAVLRDLPAPLRAQVRAVRAATPATVALALRGGRTVLWGTPGHTGRKAAMVDALLRRKGGTLDVTSPDVAVVQANG